MLDGTYMYSKDATTRSPRLGMFRFVRSLKVAVNMTPFYILERFDLVLQQLSDIVRLVKRHIGIEDDVEFYDVGWASVVAFDRVDLEDVFREHHRLRVRASKSARRDDFVKTNGRTL